MEILQVIGIIVGVIILIFILYKIIKAIIHIVPEERRLVIYRLGRFSRIAGPGIVVVIPWLEQVVRNLEVRDHPMEVTVPGIFAYGVPNDLKLNLWCSFDLVRAAANNRHKLASLAHLTDAERRQQVEVKMREALVNQIAELQNRKPLPEGATPLDGVIALAPGTDRYNDLISGLKDELAGTLPTVGVILNTSQSITVTGRNIPDVIIEAIKRTQGRQIDSKWLTKYANDLRQQFPEISNAVLDQMLASIEGVDVGNVQRLRLEQDEHTQAQVEVEVPLDGAETAGIIAKPKIKLGDTETKSQAAPAAARREPASASPGPQHLTKNDLAVLKRVPRQQPDQRKSA
jgi:hypothetical protein